MAHKSLRQWFQINLRSLLWLMLCIAVGIGGYRRGFDVGFEDGTNQRNRVGTRWARVYDIRDLVLSKRLNGAVVPDGEFLIRDITAHVLPNTWNENGGQALIKFDAPNLALVVSHDRDGLNRVEDYIERLRQQTKKSLASAK